MLDQIKIASPCSADWDRMEGDDRVRFCSECKKNVFNISAMTRRDAEALIQEKNGDLCTRLYRRSDGTVLTEDCPVGLRVKIVRAKRRLGWAIAGALSFATAWAQQKSPVLSGIVDDPAMTGIGNSKVTAVNLKSSEKITTLTNEYGRFHFDSLDRGEYKVTASAPGFKEFTSKNIVVGESERKLEIVLQIGISTMGGMIITPARRP
jgi:hypothetical protein